MTDCSRWSLTGSARISSLDCQLTVMARVLMAGFAALASSAALAQVRPDAGSILDTTKPPEQQRPAATPRIVTPPPPSMQVPSTVKVTVKGFRFTGNELFSADELNKVISDLVNKEADARDLGEAVRSISDFYRERGYFLATAYLPRQDLTAGIVHIHVLEGRLGKVNFDIKQGTRLRASVVESHLSKIPTGRLAKQDEVERPLLLLLDTGAVSVQGTASPGATVGEADFSVEVADVGRIVSGSVDVDNHGNKYAGESRVGAQLYVTNPLGFGDVLSLRGQLAQDELTRVGSLSYIFPVGGWGTKLGLGISRLEYELDGRLGTADLGQLGSKGEADIYSLQVVHPFVRSRRLNIFGQLIADLKELEDQTPNLATPTIDRRRIKSMHLGVVGDWQDFALGNGALNGFSVAVTSGETSYPTTNTTPDDYGTDGSFVKANLALRRVQGLSDALRLFLRIEHQSASKNLASVEKISGGGPYAVRAYAPGEALADEGTLITAELRYAVPRKIWIGDLTLVGFVDAATMRRNRKSQPVVDTNPVTGALEPNKRDLWGAGIGFRYSAARNFSISADFAWMVGNERPTDGVSRHPRFWLQGVKWF